MKPSYIRNYKHLETRKTNKTVLKWNVHKTYNLKTNASNMKVNITYFFITIQRPKPRSKEDLFMTIASSMS